MPLPEPCSGACHDGNPALECSHALLPARANKRLTRRDSTGWARQVGQAPRDNRFTARLTSRLGLDIVALRRDNPLLAFHETGSPDEGTEQPHRCSSDAIDAEAAAPPPRPSAILDGQQKASTAVVAFGADNVNYLGGYWRYYGGPSALVLGPDGEPDARRHARRGAGRGAPRETRSGRRLRRARLRHRAGSPSRSSPRAVGTGPGAVGSTLVGIADGLRRHGAPARASSSRRRSCQADEELVRLRLRQGRRRARRMLHAYQLCWLGQRAVTRRRSGRGIGDRDLLRRAVDAAQIAHGEPIEFLADLLVGSTTPARSAALSASRRAVRSRRASPWSRTSSFGRADTGETRPRRTCEGGIPRSRRHGPRCSRSSSWRDRSSCPATTGREIFARMAARIAEAVPGRRVSASRRPRARPDVVRGSAPDPQRRHAPRELDGHRGRAGCVRGWPVRRTGRERLRRDAAGWRSSSATQWGSRVAEAKRLHHTGFTVSDLDRSLAFYGDRPRIRGRHAAGEAGRATSPRSWGTPRPTCAWRTSSFPTPIIASSSSSTWSRNR